MATRTKTPPARVPAARLFQEREDGLRSHVRVDRDRRGPVEVEVGLGVGDGDGAYVPAFHVRDGGQPEVSCGRDQGRVDLHALGPETLEESGLRLDRRRVRLDGLENPQAELERGPRLRQASQLRRKAGRDGVEAHHERALLAAGRLRQRPHHAPPGVGASKRAAGLVARRPFVGSVTLCGL